MGTPICHHEKRHQGEYENKGKARLYGLSTEATRSDSIKQAGFDLGKVKTGRTHRPVFMNSQKKESGLVYFIQFMSFGNGPEGPFPTTLYIRVC